MSLNFSHDRFYRELESSLAQSTGAQRKSWAITIIEKDIAIIDLSALLSEDEKVASRFLWLISDVAIQNPQRFLPELPELFDYFEKNYPSYLSSFASWWHYCGVPVKNEAKAIDLLFKWFLSADTNVTVKSRALWVLVELSKKYPELKRELKLCIGDQMEKYSADFKKRARKILHELER